MKKTLTAHLCYSTASYDSAAPFQLWCAPMGGSPTLIPIKSFDVEVDIPDDFDPRPQQIKALEEKQRAAGAAFSALTTEINRQISELQAIEFTEAV